LLDDDADVAQALRVGKAGVAPSIALGVSDLKTSRSNLDFCVQRSPDDQQDESLDENRTSAVSGQFMNAWTTTGSRIQKTRRAMMCCNGTDSEVPPLVAASRQQHECQ
jgi:hypothetical protein